MQVSPYLVAQKAGPSFVCCLLKCTRKVVEVYCTDHRALRLNVNPELILWIESFLTAGRIQWTLYALYLYQICLCRKSPQDCTLSPALFTLHTDNCRSADPDASSLKCSDGIVILHAFKRLLSATGALASWWKSNHLNLKASKTKGMLIDFLCNLTPLSNLTADSETIEQRRV